VFRFTRDATARGPIFIMIRAVGGVRHCDFRSPSIRNVIADLRDLVDTLGVSCSREMHRDQGLDHISRAESWGIRWGGKALRTRRHHQALNPRHDFGCARANLVVAHSHDLPSHRAKCLINMPITLAIPPDLGGPELGVRLRNRSMLRATVPEASVNKYGYVCAAEREVRSSGKACPACQAVPQS
jgi:hypothetical protein